MKKIKKNLVFSLIAIAVVAISAGYVVYNNSSNDGLPPDFFLGSNAFKGYMVEDAGYYKFDADDVDSFTETNAEKTTLKKNLNYYYSDNEISVQDIIDSIKPIDGNRVLIAYYEPIFDEADINDKSEERFWGYPRGPKTIANPSTFKIKKHMGFAIYSQKKTEIYGVHGSDDKPEVKIQKEAPILDQVPLKYLKDIKKGWILLPYSDVLYNILESDDTRGLISEMYIQKSNGKFELCNHDQVASKLSSCAPQSAKYYMIWLNFIERDNSDAGGFDIDLNIENNAVKEGEYNVHAGEAEMIKSDEDQDFTKAKAADNNITDSSRLGIEKEELYLKPEEFLAERVHDGVIRLRWDPKDPSPIENAIVPTGYTITFYSESDPGNKVEIEIDDPDDYYHEIDIDELGNEDNLQFGEEYNFEIRTQYGDYESKPAVTYNSWEEGDM